MGTLTISWGIWLDFCWILEEPISRRHSCSSSFGRGGSPEGVYGMASLDTFFFLLMVVMWFQAHHLVSRTSLVWWAGLLDSICWLPKNISLSPSSRATYCQLSGVTTWRVWLWTADVSYGGISGVSREAACIIPQWRFTYELGWWCWTNRGTQDSKYLCDMFFQGQCLRMLGLHGELGLANCCQGDSKQWVKWEWRSGQTRPSCQMRPQPLHHCPARLPPNPKEVVRTPPCIISIGSFRLLG